MYLLTIPFFASAKSPFEPQLGSRETPPVSRFSTEGQPYPRHNQCRAALTVWDRCRLSTPRCDSKTGGSACSSKRRAQPFLLDPCGSGAIRHVCQAHPENLAREGQRVPSESPDERELSCSISPNHCTQFHWERTSLSEHPGHFSCGSEAESTTKSRYSSFRDPERSLGPGRLRRVLRHTAKNSSSHLAQLPTGCGTEC